MTTREIISSNLQLLLNGREWKPRKLAKQSGVAQTTIAKTIRLESAPTADTIERLTDTFGLPAWQLLLPYFVGDLASSEGLAKLVEHYLKSSQEGRKYINRIAEKEAGYESSGQDARFNDGDGTGAGRM